MTLKVLRLLPLTSKRIILSTIVAVAATTAIDSSLINISNLYSNPDWASRLFIIVSAIYVIGQFLILSYVRHRSRASGIRSVRRIRLAFNMVPIIQCILTGILVFVILQMLVTSSYSISFVIAAVTISYTLGMCMLGLLAHRFISWYRSNRNIVILLYGVASITLSLNLVLTLVITTAVLQSAIPQISPETICCSPLSFSPVGKFMNIINPAFVITSIFSFIMAWVATSFLLGHYSLKFGKLKYWIIMGLPLAYFLSQFLSSSLNLLSWLQASNPVLWSALITLIFTLTKPVGGILFGIAFWAIAKGIRKDSLVRDYMIISASGLLLLFTSNQATGLIGGQIYPPFGLASVSLVGYSCYLFLVGIYLSAISLSEDSSLRQSIRNFAIRESKLLDSIGIAQMEEEIQRRVITLTKQNRNRMEEESGIQSSLTEDDIQKYMEQVINEVKKARQN